MQRDDKQADGRAQRQPASEAMAARGAAATMADHRPAAAAQRRLMEGIARSPRAQLMSPVAQRQGVDDEEPLQGRFEGPAQRQEAEPAAPNRTGLPDGLKAGIESMSGLSMDHVRVHYGSSQPAQLNALAYAQGSDIHLAPGQEQHLPHEAWHVVQQAQGRVPATMQLKAGVPVNDDPVLEREADVMGLRAAALQSPEADDSLRPVELGRSSTLQRQVTQIAWGNSTAASASTTGAKGGVFFITVAGVRHIVKATSEVGATVLGEEIVGAVMGPSAATPGSQIVPNTDVEFQDIIARLRHHQAGKPAAYGVKLQLFEQATSLLVQSDLGQGRDTFRTPGTNAGLQAGDPNVNVAGDVAHDVALLEDAQIMRNVGRLLAADTLIGNADRFEQMNLDNALLSAQSLGAIDTEAMLQGYPEFVTFIGQAAVGGPSYAGVGDSFRPQGAGTDNVTAYVDFVLRSGREISDADDTVGHAAAPSSMVIQQMTDLQVGWFEKKFIAKLVGWSQPQVVAGYLAAGYPQRPFAGANRDAFEASRWFTHVWPNLHQGYQDGLVAIRQFMTGPAFVQTSQRHAQLQAGHGARPNFNLDALRIRGMYMTCVAAGKDPVAARQEALAYVRSKLGAAPPGHDKAVRVVAQGVTLHVLTQEQAELLRWFLPSVNSDTLDESILHLRGKGKKIAHGIMNTVVPLVDTELLDRRLEALRAACLRHLLQSGPESDLAVAVQAAVSKARDLRAADVDQFSYATKKGARAARDAMLTLGADMANWAPKVKQ